MEDGFYSLVLFINGPNGNATDNEQRMELVIHTAVICWGGGYLQFGGAHHLSLICHID